MAQTRRCALLYGTLFVGASGRATPTACVFGVGCVGMSTLVCLCICVCVYKSGCDMYFKVGCLHMHMDRGGACAVCGPNSRFGMAGVCFPGRCLLQGRAGGWVVHMLLHYACQPRPSSVLQRRLPLALHSSECRWLRLWFCRCAWLCIGMS